MSKITNIVKCKECRKYYTIDRVNWFSIWNGKDFNKEALCAECSKLINQKPEHFNAKIDLKELLNSGRAKIKM